MNLLGLIKMLITLKHVSDTYKVPKMKFELTS